MDQEYTAQYLEELARKWKDGTLSDAERIAFDKWYNSHNDELLELTAGYSANPLVLRDEIEAKLLEQIRMAKGVPQRRITKFSTWIAIAAGLTLIVSLAIYFRNASPTRTDWKLTTNDKPIDVAPGNYKATITLPNGKIMDLSSSQTGVVVGAEKLTYSDGSLLHIVTDGEGEQEIASIPRNDVPELTATTPRGGMYQVVLADGSKVWLNAASQIKFPADFKKLKSRIVTLTGEAYFEVVHNPLQPFIVKMGKQQVEVLGTRFNINSYNDDHSPLTTLAEGRVRLSLTGGVSNGNVILKPGQQAHREGDHFKVEAADLDLVLAWKNGKLKFRDATISQIMKEVSRWYDIDIRYDGAVPQERFIGGISRKAELSSLLKIFEASQIKFRLEQRGGRKTLVIKP